MPNKELIPHLFRTESSKIIAVLTKVFGLANVALAEDIVSDTFLTATEKWTSEGLPDNPTAWLYTVAKNKTRDFLRRDQHFSQTIAPTIKARHSEVEEIQLDWSEKNITDSQLKMMFAICHPDIPEEAQVGLALRILCGFGIEEIALAFLTSKAVINKRLYRAKEKLRSLALPMELPSPSEMEKRLENVLRILYLLFNEGYYSQTKHLPLRKELCFEAMRLNYLLTENERTNKPFVNALLSLMCFHASRFEARMSKAGEIILYDDQDRNLWDDDLIAKANHFLIESAKGDVITKFHLEASIAYWHATKQQEEDKWEHILQLYNRLLQIEYSPIAALNRTYALAQANGMEKGIEAAEKLALVETYSYHLLLGNLYTSVEIDKAKSHYHLAQQLAKSEAEKKTIAGYLRRMEAID